MPEEPINPENLEGAAQDALNAAEGLTADAVSSVENTVAETVDAAASTAPETAENVLDQLANALAGNTQADAVPAAPVEGVGASTQPFSDPNTQAQPFDSATQSFEPQSQARYDQATYSQPTYDQPTTPQYTQPE